MASTTNKLGKGLLRGLLVMALTVQPMVAEARALGKAVARGAGKAVTKSLRRTPAETLRRDLLRDRVTPVRMLRRDRHVFRFTTKERALREIRKGVPAGSHMTSRATPGRPPSSLQARRLYGLPQKPGARERIHLHRGEQVRFNRVLGGKRGKGELISPKRVPPDAIEKVVPLR